MAARHNQFRAQKSIRNLSEVWGMAIMGLRPDDAIAITVAGFITDLDKDAAEVCNVGIPAINQPAAPISVDFVSENAADNQFIYVTFLDENRAYTQTIIQLNGLTPVPLSVGGVPVLSFRMLEARNASGFDLLGMIVPDGGEIIGPVWAYKSGTTPDGADSYLKITQYVDLGAGIETLMVGQRSYNSNYSIPAGWTGYFQNIQPWTGKNDYVKMAFQGRPFGGQWATEIPLAGTTNITSAAQDWRTIPEGFDVRIIAQEGSGTGDVPCLLQYQLLLIRNDEVNT